MNCEICNKWQNSNGAGRYQHGMAHVRNGEAERYLDFCGREPNTFFEIEFSRWAFRPINKQTCAAEAGAEGEK